MVKKRRINKRNVTPIIGHTNRDEWNDLIGLWVIEGQEPILGRYHWGAGNVSVGYVNDKQELVAGITYNNYVPNRSIEISVRALPNTNWYDEQTRWEIADFAFNQGNVVYLRAKVAETNVRSKNLIERYGFELEYSFPEACETGNLLVYRIDKESARTHLQKFKKKWLEDYNDKSEEIIINGQRFTRSTSST